MTELCKKDKSISFWNMGRKEVPQKDNYGNDIPGTSVTTYFGEILLYTIIGELALFLGGNWSEAQINMAAHLVFQNHSHLTLNQFKYFANKVMGGEYVSNKNFGPGVLMEWVNEYSNEIAIEYGKVKAYEWKEFPKFEEPENPISSEVFNEAMKDVLKPFIEFAEQDKQEHVNKWNNTRESERKRQQRLFDLAWNEAHGELDFGDITEDDFKD